MHENKSKKCLFAVSFWCIMFAAVHVCLDAQHGRSRNQREAAFFICHAG